MRTLLETLVILAEMRRESELQEGEVKFFDKREGKRFGFIKPKRGGKDVFFHWEYGRNVIERYELLDTSIFTGSSAPVPTSPAISTRTRHTVLFMICPFRVELLPTPRAYVPRPSHSEARL